MTSYTSSTATVNVDIPNNWNSGFVANVAITAEQAISGWQIEIQFSGDIQNIWGARIVSHNGDTYVIEALSWNANISEGGTQSFGFVGAGSADDVAPNSINGDSFGDDTNDVVTFPGDRDDYSITQIDDVTVEITGPEGTEVYSDIATFEFADMTQTFEELLVPRLANLEAEEIAVTDNSLAPDETTTVTVEISSNGTIGAGATSAELVVASDPNGTSIIGSYGNVDLSAIATGENTTATFDFDPGDLEPGTYWVAVRVDSDDILTEENEADNLTEWVEVTVEGPPEPVIDIAVTGVEVLASSDLEIGFGGGTLDLAIELENLGDISSLTGLTVTLSTDGTASADDLILWTGSADVAAGSAFTLNISATLDGAFVVDDFITIILPEDMPITPVEALVAGDYTIFVTADTVGDVDIGNNTMLTGVELTAPVNPGTEGDDIWISGDSPVSVDLLGGDDTAIAGLQGDVVEGAAGFDTVDFSQINERMDIYIDADNLSLGIQAAAPSLFTQISYWSGFEEIIATSFNDSIFLPEVESALVIDAGAGDDLVQDGAGDDTILLGAGDDMVFNWLGDDTITTGEGSDLVLVIRDTDGTYFDIDTGSAGGGHDVVLDFDINDDILFVLFTEDEDYDPFTDLTQTADGALLNYADDASILLVGVDINDLSASNFISEQEADPIMGSITG